MTPKFRFPWRLHRRRRQAMPELVQLVTRLDGLMRERDMRDLYDRGLRRDQIAARCGVPVRTVCAVVEARP